MSLRLVILIPFLFCISCNPGKKDTANTGDQHTETDSTFNKSKWYTREGEDYPFRDLMVNDVLYNDTIRSLEKDEILELLGEPDRSENGYLYYMISQKRLGFWPLHTKTLVVKFSNDSTIDWIKIHE